MEAKDVRKRVLPGGWYPTDPHSLEDVLQEWGRSVQPNPELKGRGAVVPHAGWGFSGHLAFKTLRLLDPACDLVIVIGGHMRPGAGVVAAREDAIASPLGLLQVDKDFLSGLDEQMRIGADQTADNTVEVQIPIIKYLFPKNKILWLRCGAGEEALDLGRSIAGVARESGKKVCVVGSTDLTHYGPNYGFTPHGIGEDAREWAQNENDAGIIRHMLEMNSREVLAWGNERMAACSSGAAAAVIECISQWGAKEGILIGYDSSYAVHPDSSFVGYAGILYSCAAS